MGAVYQAKDLKRQGTVCAIKEMSLSMVSPAERDQAIQNFKNEAKMLWGLNHPNLPALTGFFAENQRYYLVMEYVDGLTLEAYLERNRAGFSERRVLGWARQLCDVLQYLHEQKPPIIFRDMKPGNVMLTRNGQIKLIDFGIARFFRPSGSPDTQLLGTPGFAPPEQYGKAQTDERSDIYALGMTLFQLLTNTLSEKGFGLRDVHANFPQVSLLVARALEKATALEVSDRYESVAAFRRALLGEGTFVFENGDMASTPAELAELCMHFPDEAADYLAAGEFESWLHEIGEDSLSRAAAQIRKTIPDPQQSIVQFLRVVLSKNQHSTSTVRSNENGNGNGHAATAVQDRDLVVQTTRNTRVPHWLVPRRSTLQVSPRTLDFGMVYPGISSPLAITILGDQTAHGAIHVTEPWIKVDQHEFDGTHTYVNVRINSSQLRDQKHCTGSIVIAPDPSAGPEVVVKVQADIQPFSTRNGLHRPKTVVPDLDEDEEEETFPPGQLSFTSYRGTSARQVQQSVAQDDDQDKYTSHGSHAGTSGPLVRRMWQQTGLTFSSAFMAASLLYIIFSRQLPLPLPPDARFIAILAGMVPTATIGALLVNWKRSWGWPETINRAVTGMGCVLLLLALARGIWQAGLSAAPATLQLFIMLLCAAVAATVGTDIYANTYIVEKLQWALQRMRRFVKPLALGIGGALGYCLGIGLALGGFTVFGILVGMGVAAALVWHVDYLLTPAGRP